MDINQHIRILSEGACDTEDWTSEKTYLEGYCTEI